MGMLDFLFGAPEDNTAEEMRRQEEERLARIREGTNAINRIFGGDVTTQTSAANPEWASRVNAGKLLIGVPRNLVQTTKTKVPGQFDDDFFNTLESNYLDYYMPQFDRQAGDADRALRINLARSGNIGGSVGAREFGRLAETEESERRRLIDEATKYSMGERSRLESTRGNLISQLEAGSGIDNVAAQAEAQAKLMTAPPAFSPLGDLFSKYTAAVANSTLASGNPSYPGAEDQRRALLFNIPSVGSSKSASYG